MLEAPDKIKLNETLEVEVVGLTGRIQSAYEKYMQAEVLALIRTNRYELGEDYLPMLQKHFFDVKSGLLDVGSTRFFEFVAVMEHFVELMWFCMSSEKQIPPKEEVEKWVKSNLEEAGLLFDKLLVSAKKK